MSTPWRSSKPRPAGRAPGAIAALLLTAALLLNLTACDGDDSPTGMVPNEPQTTDFITGVTDGVSNGTFSPNDAPASTGGPTATVAQNSMVINGGATQSRIATSGPAAGAIIFVDVNNGFYDIRFAAPTTSATLVLTFAQTLPANSFNIMYAAIGTDGSIGPYVAQPTQVTAVGTGELQISLSWDAPSDVDLHVVEPTGQEIFFGNPMSAGGGRLDLDSNAGCAIDNVNNENVTYATAPRGNYTVRVDYWSSCNVSRTEFVLTIIDQGTAPRIFRGNFTGGGDMGGAGSGRTITTFTR